MEEESSFFDESNAAFNGKSVERENSIPIVTGIEPEVKPETPGTSINIDDIKVAQKENYNLGEIKDENKTTTSAAKQKRTFLKRGTAVCAKYM